ncbi:MAG: hypothetical protein NVS3B26_25550 [Mycobacteriales bacterium]
MKREPDCSVVEVYLLALFKIILFCARKADGLVAADAARVVPVKDATVMAAMAVAATENSWRRRLSRSSWNLKWRSPA